MSTSCSIMTIGTCTLLLAFAACGEQEQEASPVYSDALWLDHAGLRVTELRADTISRDTLLGRPVFLAATGDAVWIADHGGEPWLHVFDLQARRIVRSTGRTGDGPGDFRYVSALFEDPESDLFMWAYDGRRDALSRHEAPGSATADSVRVVSLSGRGFQTVGPMGAGRFLGFRPRSDTARFELFDSAGTVISSATVPFPGPDSLPRGPRFSAATTQWICTKDDGSAFAVFSTSVGRIELYDGNLEKTGEADVPFPSEERFGLDTAASGRIRPTYVEYRDSYTGCSYSNTHLFALYRGRLRWAPREPGESTVGGRFVHVFDLRGRLVGVLDLGRVVAWIDVDREGRNLYATSDSDALLLRYGLPEKM